MMTTKWIIIDYITILINTLETDNINNQYNKYITQTHWIHFLLTIDICNNNQIINLDSDERWMNWFYSDAFLSNAIFMSSNYK